ncbi:MAG: dTDP-4-dehydrorhamnose reductase [Geminicoccaceae bacterium]
MKLALLGSNGQLGQDILARADRRFEIVPVSRAQLDVTDGEALARLLPSLDADVVVNATSYHRTDEAEDQAGLAVAVNAHAVQRMAEVCARSGIRFVHVSTDYVFSGIDRRQPYTETDAPGPLNVYGASKLMGESLAAISAPDALVLRVASLFGVAGSSGKGGNFVETMLRLARERGEVRVVDDIVMSPTSTADLAGWLLDMVAAGAPPGTYHLVNSGLTSWCGFARAILSGAGLDAGVVALASSDYPTRARRPAFSALDNSKAAQTLGRELAPWEDALERYLRAKGHRS